MNIEIWKKECEKMKDLEDVDGIPEIHTIVMNPSLNVFTMVLNFFFIYILLLYKSKIRINIK